MKAYVLFILLLLPVFIHSLDYYPIEKSFSLESSFYTGLFLGNKSGGNISSKIGASDLFEDIYIGGNLGYQFQEDYKIKNSIFYYLEGGYRSYIKNILSITPTLSIGPSFTISQGVSFDLKLSLPIDLHIINRNIFSINPGVTFKNNSLDFTLLFGVKRSIPILIDVEPIGQNFTISPKYFSPDNDGVDDFLLIKLLINNPSSLKSWRVDIINISNDIIFTKSGYSVLPLSIIWNGKTNKGESVNSATEYTIRFSTTDYLGNINIREKVIITDILIEPFNGLKKVKVDSIIFPPSSFSFSTLEDKLVVKNNEVLDIIASKLKLFPEYNIVVVGHGNILHWQNKSESSIENENIVIPLTEKRAEAVWKELILRGIDPKSVTFKGEGGNYPIVPFDDNDNWKNRRVEFILEK